MNYESDRHSPPTFHLQQLRYLLEVERQGTLTRAAEELGADLIIMGTRGNTGLKHVILGSVAERTIRHAPCSVWTVKTDD